MQVQVIEKPTSDERVDAFRLTEKPMSDERVDTVRSFTKKSFQSAGEKGSSSYRCGYCGYVHGAKRCPARGKTCNVCRGLGHFASVCKTKKTNVQAIQPEELAVSVPISAREDLEYRDCAYTAGVTSGSNEGELENTVTTSSHSPSSFQIGALDGAAVEKTWKLRMIANSLPINFKLDTGAQANILPHSVFHQLSPRPQLHPASTRLFAYGAEFPLAVEGQCICDVQFEGGRSRKLRFFVLSPTVTAEPLLGLQACDQLNLIMRVSAVESPELEAVRNDPVAREYIDLFDGVGRMDLYTYKIRLREGALPFALATARKVPYNLYDKVRLEIQRMMRLGVVKEVVEPTEWASPMVVIPKKDGSVRICVDYTKLNKSVERERYQLHVAEEIFAKLSGARFFTILDAASGFWQIPLDEECSSLTTFITPFGRFRFTRLPFGISSGPEVFHRAMQQVLQGLRGVDCFIDDVLVWGTTRGEHDERLRLVLDRCKANGVRLQPGKCMFRSSTVRYCGHVLTENGL